MQFCETGEAPQRAANRDPNYCPHGIYPAKGEDEWCAISGRGDEDFARLCSSIEHEELVSDPRFASHSARVANEDALDEDKQASDAG